MVLFLAVVCICLHAEIHLLLQKELQRKSVTICVTKEATMLNFILNLTFWLSTSGRYRCKTQGPYNILSICKHVFLTLFTSFLQIESVFSHFFHYVRWSFYPLMPGDNKKVTYLNEKGHTYLNEPAAFSCRFV